MQAAPKPDGAGEPTPAKVELPIVESPPLSPASESPAIATDTPAPPVEPIAADAPAIEPTVAAAAAPRLRLILQARHRRYAVLAASVTLAAALGAVLGALASGGLTTPGRTDAAIVEQNKAVQQSIARLGNEITALKASLEQTNKPLTAPIAKVSERLDRAAAEITGSIAPPRTTVPASTPLPRPAPRLAVAEFQPPARTPVVPGWSIRDSRNGYVYVEGHGEVYQVVLGAPLPGLGPVQSVKRENGRWMVVTPRGIIVSMRDRRYFEDF
jgi:hypothetical protein